MRRYFLLAGLLGVVWCSASWAAVMTVKTDIFDDGTNGTCSLKEAFMNASGTFQIYPDCPKGDQDPIVDEIRFEIPGPGVKKIMKNDGFSYGFDQSVIIDGLSQPGSSCDNILIEINQLPNPIYTALTFTGNDGGVGSKFIVRGLSLGGFSHTSIYAVKTKDMEIYCNHIGVNASGTMANPNGSGIHISEGSNINVHDNLISGNSGNGVLVSNGWMNLHHNKIGTNFDGSSFIPNKKNGVEVFPVESQLSPYASVEIKNNLIAGNVSAGVRVFSQTNEPLPPKLATILDNRIYSNGSLGIDLGQLDVNQNDPGDIDEGANGLLNFPVLTSAQIINPSQMKVDFDLDVKSDTDKFIIQFFANPLAGLDPTGFGEGEMLIGSAVVTTDFSPGPTKHTVVLDISSIDPDMLKNITATATEAGAFGSTSEFGRIINLTRDDLDYGDAIDPYQGSGYQNYNTRSDDSGASHELDPEVFLGQCVDADSGQLNDLASLADDQSITAGYGTCAVLGDDEDGVIWQLMTAGTSSKVKVTAHGAGYLNAWIDFDHDGFWEGDEEIINDLYLSPGPHTVLFGIPESVLDGVTYARFRFYKDQDEENAYRPVNPAGPGEVEDYKISIRGLEGAATTQWTPVEGSIKK